MLGTRLILVGIRQYLLVPVARKKARHIYILLLVWRKKNNVCASGRRIKREKGRVKCVYLRPRGRSIRSHPS